MDEKKQEQEFTLEDILKEFGTGTPEEPEAEETLPEEPAQALPEDPPEEPARETPPAVSEAEPPRPTPLAAPLDEPEQDTIRLDTAAISAAAKSAVSDETRAFEPVSGGARTCAPDSGDTQAFEPVTDDDVRAYTPKKQQPDIPENAEPFGDSWEPPCNQPIGEYVPPEPIVFRPRSQYRELKRKLVAGPERRYYALTEEGIGKLQISIFLSLLVVVLGFASLGMHRIGMVQENRMRLLVFGELFAMVFSALLASGQLLKGLTSVFKGKFTLDSLLTATFLICMADGYFCLKEVRVPFCAAFCLEVTMSLWAETERRGTEMGQMDTMRKATGLTRVAKAPGCWEDRPGFYTEPGEVEDFMDSYAEASGSEKALRIYALLSLLITGMLALVTGFSRGLSAGFQIWSASILAAAPVTVFISQSRPMAILERRLHRLGAVLCGPRGVRNACGSAAVPITDRDLFPEGTAKINGVKFYTSRDPEQVIAFAAALISRSGSCLAPLFDQLLHERGGQHWEPGEFRIYESGGLGGQVCGQSVLAGTTEFLSEMGVEIPQGAQVAQAVYLAIDGEFSAVFALAFGKLRGVSAGLGTLCNYRSLTPVLTSDNFLLSPGFIRARFNVNIRRLAFPSLSDRRKTAHWEPDSGQSAVCALLTQPGLAGFAFSITGARSLRTAGRMGAAVHILGGILGICMVAVLTMVGGSSLLTPLNLVLYELAWMVPGILITEWTRSL